MDLNHLKADIIEDGIVDAKEVATLQEALYEDGIIDQEEADLLFAINDAVSGNANDPSWPKFFIDAITKFVLGDEESPGEVDESEFKYLREKIGADGQVDETELALVINITKKANNCCDEFNTYTLDCLYQAIIEDGIIDEDEVDMIRTVIFSDGGAGGADIDNEEATFLFKLNDACSGNANSDVWKVLFVEALTKFVLEDEESPGEIDEDEAQFLIKNIWNDGSVDEAEKALLLSLKKQATKIHPSLLNVFIKLSL